MKPTAALLLLLLFLPGVTRSADDDEPKLQRLNYNHPGLDVDLGVGLWAWPMPVDYDGDGEGDRDLIVGIGDWTDYTWDHAYDAQGRWRNGPLHGYVYLIE